MDPGPTQSASASHMRLQTFAAPPCPWAHTYPGMHSALVVHSSDSSTMPGALHFGPLDER